MSIVPPTVLNVTTDFVPSGDARRLEARSYLSLFRIIGRRVLQPAPSDLVPVVLVPGFVAGDFSLAVLARRLRTRGHRTFGSQLGANLGCTEVMVDRLIQRLEQVARDEGRRVALVGHSRGGMVVKLAAQRRPDLIAAIVLLSAPVTGVLSMAPHVRKQLEVLFRLHARGLRGVISEDCVTGECAVRIATELAGPFPADVEYTSIYSVWDAIIDFQTCLDPDADLVEIHASHTGMATDPAVQRIVAERLASVGARDLNEPQASGY
jgi:triacylglycerol lipase